MCVRYAIVEEATESLTITTATYAPRGRCDSSHILTSCKKRYQNMDQRTKNRDVSAAAVSPIKQRESETNKGRVIEKDQRQEKVNIRFSEVAYF